MKTQNKITNKFLKSFLVLISLSLLASFSFFAFAEKDFAGWRTEHEEWFWYEVGNASEKKKIHYKGQSFQTSRATAISINRLLKPSAVFEDEEYVYGSKGGPILRKYSLSNIDRDYVLNVLNAQIQSNYTFRGTPITFSEKHLKIIKKPNIVITEQLYTNPAIFTEGGTVFVYEVNIYEEDKALQMFVGNINDKEHLYEDIQHVDFERIARWHGFNEYAKYARSEGHELAFLGEMGLYFAGFKAMHEESYGSGVRKDVYKGKHGTIMNVELKPVRNDLRKINKDYIIEKNKQEIARQQSLGKKDFSYIPGKSYYTSNEAESVISTRRPGTYVNSKNQKIYFYESIIYDSNKTLYTLIKNTEVEKLLEDVDRLETEDLARKYGFEPSVHEEYTISPVSSSTSSTSTSSSTLPTSTVASSSSTVSEGTH